MRRLSIPRPVRFGLVGGSGLFVDLSAYAVLLTFLPVPLARAIAIWTAMSWNFALNRRLTFRVAKSTPVIRQYVLFCSACLLGAAVSWSVSVGLHHWVTFFADRNILGATAGVIGGTGFNYAMCSLVVFRPNKRAPDSQGTAAAPESPVDARVEPLPPRAMRRTV